jgi:hypothetical protein
LDRTDPVGVFSNLFDPDALAWWMLVDRKTAKGRCMPSRGALHQPVHVWKRVLEQAGFALNDPHRMTAAMQVAARPMQHGYIVVTGDWRYERVWKEPVWPKAIHRVAAEGISPEQAVDEVIARIKRILSE